MKFVRLLLLVLALCAGLAATLVVLCIAPVVQTWAAQWELAHQPNLKGTVDSVSAGFGEVDIDNLHVERDGVVLTLPSLKAKLPLTVAVLARNLRVTSLEATGWTLDLSALPGAVSPERAALLLAGTLMRTPLPFDASWDGVNLDGDVLLASATGGAPSRVHLTLTGGGLARGHEGSYTLDASGVTPWSASTALTAHGTLVVAMDTPRVLDRVRLDLVLSGLTGLHQDDLAVVAGAAADPATGNETYSFDASQGGRHLATVHAAVPRDAAQITGTWSVDLTEVDLASFLPDHPLPALAARGAGHFDADPEFARLHVAGRLQTRVSRLGALAAPLEAVGPLALDATFDGTREGPLLRFSQLEVAAGGGHAALTLEALQSFTVDAGTGILAVNDPAKDWVDAAVQSIPVAWLQGLAGKVVLGGTTATGEWLVRAADGGFTLSSRAPLTAAGMTLQLPGQPPGAPFDLSAALSGSWGHDGWRLRAAPLTLDRDGRRLVTIEAQVSSPTAEDQPSVVTGTWQTTLATLVPAARQAALGPFAGGSASGDFSLNATPGTATGIDSKFLISAPDPTRSIAGTAHLDLDGAGGVNVDIPFKVTTGTVTSDLSVEGSWTTGNDRNQIDLTVTGGTVAIEHLRLLAAPLAPAIPPGRTRDPAPFWGDLTGHVSLAFDRVKLEDRDLLIVGGILGFESGSIRLASGHGGPEGHTLTNIEGLLSFDPAADVPYHLQAKVGSFEVDAAQYLTAPAGQDPLVEGKFKVDSSVAGAGTSLPDLVAHTQELFQLTSSSGIVHLLRTDVSAAIPEASTPVADSVGTVGTAFTAILGTKRTFGENNKLSANANAVLDLTNQVGEIGCDLVAISAARDNDGTIHLLKIDATAADVFLTGSGQIAPVKGLALAKRPLSLDVRFGARLTIANLMRTAGIVGTEKDDKGFSVVPQVLHFGGTLEQVDAGPWHDLLAKAAAKVPPKKKS